MNPWIPRVALFSAAAYGYDVVWRPSRVAKRARAHADSLGLPLLNVGAGTKGSSLRARTLGPTTWGDHNVDLAGRQGGTCLDDDVCFADAHYLPYADGTFGAVILSHCLEHVDDPARVLAECERVIAPGGKVYAITPALWAPHTWLYTDHQWLVLGPDEGPKKWLPLWRRRQTG